MTILNFPSNLPTFNGEVYNEPQPQTATGQHIAGSYTLRTLNLTIKNGTAIELAGVFVQMEIFEDAFKYAIEGKVRIRDYVGGIEKFVITGGEKLSIVLLKPNGNNEIIVARDDLIITKVSQVAFQQNNFLVYDLHFASNAAVQSMKKKIFKGFGLDKSLTSVVKKLYSEISTESNLNIFSDTITLDNSYVCTGQRPLEAINQLAKRACAGKDFFLFFERFGKNPGEPFTHVFIQWNKMKEFWFSTNIPQITYNPNVSQTNYSNSNENEGNINSHFVRIEPNFDHMANVKVGFYNSRIRSLNLLKRTYTDTKIDYKNESEQELETLYDNKFIESSNIFNTFDTIPTIERLIVEPTNDSVRNKAAWLKYDTYGAVLNTAIRLTCQVYGGGNKLSVGNLIELKLPSHANVSTNSSVRHDNQVYSGKYMITAIKHTITPKVYVKTLELGRGSLRFDIDTIIRNYPTNNSETVNGGSPITTTAEQR